MNIEQAKTIPISVILDKLNQKPQRTNGYRVCYFSPFRNEKTPSLWVNTKENTWHDFGEVKWKGGDSIDLVRAYLDSQHENSEVTDGLRWLRNMTGFIPAIKPVIDPNEVTTDSKLLLRKTTVVNNSALLNYGRSRGIPQDILKQYFQQAYLFNSQSQKSFNALCMRNDKKGYELRNPYFKGCIGNKYITFIRGSVPKPEGINIFEGAFDFVTVVTQQEGKPFEDDCLILHTLSNLQKATAYMRHYGYRFAYTWMDNDKAGEAASKSWEEFCKTEEGLTHIPMNEQYLDYKDVNAAHIARLKL